jgi:hypothetical protein
MAWWVWLVLGWVVLAVLIAGWLGAAATVIKRRERDDLFRQLPDRLLPGEDQAPRPVGCPPPGSDGSPGAAP